MAQAEMTQSVILHLSENEAVWLKVLLQNPTEEKESVNSSRIRKSIWEALDSANVRSV